MAAKTWSAAADGNWSAGGNWNGGTVPATTDTITFNGTSVKNCTVDALGTWSGGTVTITSAYSGTITQSVGITSGAYSIAGGTWDCNGQSFTLTGTAGTFSESGGIFKAPSGTMICSSSFTYSGGTFTHNSGTVRFSPSTIAGSTVNTNGSDIFFANTITGGSRGLTIAANTAIHLGASPTTSLSSTSQTLTVNGTVDGSGTWNVASNHALSVGSGGTVTGFGTLSIGTNLTINSAAVWDATCGLNLLAGVASQSVDANGIVFATSTINMSTNNLVIAAGTTIPLGDSPAIGTSGTTQTLTLNGTLNVNSGVLSLNGLSGGLGLTISSTGAITGSPTGITGRGTLSINSAASVGALDLTFSTTASTARTWDLGGRTYGNFRRTGTGSAQLTLVGSNTFVQFRDDDGSVAHTILFTAGTTQTASSWLLRGSSGKLLTLNSVTSGSAFTLANTGAGIVCADYLSLKDSTVDAGPPLWYAGTHSTNTSGNTNWNFAGCAYVLNVSPGAYSISGGSASLLATRLLNATPGAYNLTGAAAKLLAARLLNASPGSYALTGRSALLAHGYALLASPGSYGISGADAKLLATRLLNLAAGSYTISGKDADLSIGGTPKAKKGSPPPFGYAPFGELTDKLRRKREEEEIAQIITTLEAEEDD